MKLVILGATGKTGRHLTEQALNKGHKVKAIVRNPDKITIEHENLEVVTADIFNADDLTDHVTSCDAVFSCLGPPLTIFSDVNVNSEPIKAVCSAMTKAEVKRLVCVSGWLADENQPHPWYINLVKRIVVKMLEDKKRMEKYLIESGDIDFTVVRPPGLTQDIMDGRDLLAVSDVHFASVMSGKLPRADLAKFMLKVVEENLFVRKLVAVGLPK